MKTFLTTILLLGAWPPVAHSQVAVAPDPVTVTQPDNSRLTIVGKGTAANPYTETTDGYTVVRNNKGYYVYAILDKQHKLVAGKRKAHNPEERSRCERKYLKKKLTVHLRQPQEP